MTRSKWVAVIAGVLAIALSIGYLLLVQLLDFRGDFQPAPVSLLEVSPFQSVRLGLVAAIAGLGT